MSRNQSTGRRAVVTGAAEGIGQAIAVRLAEDGLEVVLADLKPAEETLSLIEAAGGTASAVATDVSSPQSVQGLHDRVQELGGCDVLVNNAGIYPFILFEDLTFEEWRRIFGINVDGAFLTTRAFLPGMKERGWGRVINMSSNAFMNGADPMLAGYVASKGAVIGLTRALASEYGPYGITVNAVAPGLLVTAGTLRAIGGGPEDPAALKWHDMRALQAIRRNGDPSDLVGAISFLASDEASYITAQTLVVDGGLARV